MNIDEKTKVPIEWLFAVIAPTSIVVMCFAHIDARLTRIEDKLELTPYNAFNVERDSVASEKHLSNHAQKTGEHKK